MLPNESLLQVLHFADYKTLVFAKLSAKRFLCLVTKFDDELAHRRKFRVTVSSQSIRYEDPAIRSLPKRLRYDPGHRASLDAACREVATVVGQHAVAELMFCENTWNTPYVAVIFESAPPLKYAEVDLSGLTGPLDAFMSNFAGTRLLHLSIDSDVFRELSWTFLRTEVARELRRIRLFITLSPGSGDKNRFTEGVVRSCTTLPRLLDEDELTLDFSNKYFSAAFVLRVIEMLKESGRVVTCRMTLWDQLVLDESEYAVDVDGTTTRYPSAESGLVVEVKGDYVAIRSTAEGHSAKQDGGTNESAANDTFHRTVLIRLR
ncbi:hypothetical protein AAVH_18335 [Aphelenchoides avenae]|nr:hypothetical protein AAVH_18335 [Aphelenchus avenae]